MTDVIEVHSVASGFNYTVYIGCEVDDHGDAVTETANKIVGGWATSEGEARGLASGVLNSE